MAPCESVAANVVPTYAGSHSRRCRSETRLPLQLRTTRRFVVMLPGSGSRSLSSGGALPRPVGSLLRDDVKLRHAFAFPRCVFARVLQIRLPSLKSRAQGRPGARCTRGLACKIVQGSA